MLRIFGVDSDTRNAPDVVEVHALPMLCAVDGLVQTVAIADIVSRISLSRSNPNDILVVGVDFYRADGGYALFVEG
jgi:hypothetical protein